jgi:hypothetical protein
MRSVDVDTGGADDPIDVWIGFSMLSVTGNLGLLVPPTTVVDCISAIVWN